MIGEIYILLEKWTDLISEKNVKKRDLGISEIPNIDEVDGIYLASPQDLLWSKTEPPDYILMFCSANVPGITYKISFDNFVVYFWEKIFESSTKVICCSGSLSFPSVHVKFPQKGSRNRRQSLKQ